MMTPFNALKFGVMLPHGEYGSGIGDCFGFVDEQVEIDS